MNTYQQFGALFKPSQRGVAKIIADKRDGSYLAQTTQAQNEILLHGNGFQAGQTVYYDVSNGRILGVAPDLEVQDMPV